MEIPSTFIVRRPEAAKRADDIDFRQYWRAITRRFVPAAAVSTLVLGLSAAAILLQKPSYESSGKLLIRPDRTPSLTGLNDNRTRDFEPITIQSNPLKTEIEVLQSQPLLQKVIDRLKLADANGNSPAVVEVAEQLNVEVAGGTDVLKVVYSSSDPTLAAVIANTVMELYIENNVVLNQAEAAAARDFIQAELPSAEADVRQAELALSRFQQANELVVIEDEARSAVDFVTQLDEQIATVQSELANTSARLGGLQNQLNLSAAQALDLSAISQSQGVQEALLGLQTVETQLVEARSFFNDNSPQVIELGNRATSLRQLLRSRVSQVVGTQSAQAARSFQIGELEQALIGNFIELEVQRLGLRNQITALDTARDSYAQRMNDLPELARQQKLLERQLEAVQITYETLLTNLQELKTTGNQALGNARIIEPAILPTSPTLNKKSLAIGLGGVLGSLGAFAAVVLLLEGCDRTVKTLDELKQLYSCDLLEAIPKSDKASSVNAGIGSVIVRDAPRALVSEVYRSLQVKLQYFNDVRAFKAVTVVSATPEEGTSDVAANLAMATAELKQRILLIDANLRSPKQDLLWGLPNIGNGLSHVLQGETSLQDALQKVNSHLWVLPAGQEPPSPLALLRSPKMKSLIKAAAQSFDAIVIDAPSLLSAPDALVLGKLSDGVVVVSELGKVDRANIIAANEALRKSHQSVLGLIVTGAGVKDQPGDRWLYESEADSTAGATASTTTGTTTLSAARGMAGFSARPMAPMASPADGYADSRSSASQSSASQSSASQASTTTEFTSADFAAQQNSREAPTIRLNADGLSSVEITSGEFVSSEFISDEFVPKELSGRGNGSANGNGNDNGSGNGSGNGNGNDLGSNGHK